MLILLLHATELDAHAWGIAFGRLCAVFILGMGTIKLFKAGRSRWQFSQDETSTEMPIEYVPRSARLLAMSWMLVVALTLSAAIATVATESLIELYESFGANVTVSAMFFINGKYLWWLLPLGALILASQISVSRVHQKKRQAQLGRGVIALSLVSLLLFVVAIYALYAPIAQLNG